MATIRIGYLTSEYPAPSHTFIRREVNALRARGLEITTFSVRRPAAASRLSEIDREAERTTCYLRPVVAWDVVKTHGFALIRYPKAYITTLIQAIRHRAPGTRALLWSIFHFAEAILLAARLQEFKVGHLHNHFGNSGSIVGMLTSRFLEIPWSMTFHGGRADWTYPSGYLLPDKLKAASFVSCVSQFGRAQAFGVCPQSHWNKMFVSRCGVDLAVFPPRKRVADPTGKVRLLSVGRLSPEKGQLGLLLAFAKLVSRGIDADLRIVGGGPCRDDLTNAIADLGLVERCTLAGQQTEEEVLNELAETDLFVQSSFVEGLPVVLMEALGMHVPVIAPRISGIPELVRNGETGLLFTVGDWDELAEKMEVAVRDPELRARLAESGHTLVTQQYEINRAVEPLFQQFQKVCSGSPPR